MATFTPRLGLKKYDGADPFLRSDFNTLSDVLDASPGVLPCTSTTRPNWSGPQAGRLIVETDTRTILRWTGTAFEVIYSRTPFAAGYRAVNAAYGNNALVTQSGIVSLTAPMGGVLMVFGTVFVRTNVTTLGVGFTLLDGADPLNHAEFRHREVQHSSSSAPERTLPLMGYKNVTAGTAVSIGVRMSQNFSATGSGTIYLGSIGLYCLVL